eukprot:Hpha_TRINITY_DN2857_c0_g1::TRINITY_DN2857_c0_g1_i1::g.171471::m.171471
MYKGEARIYSGTSNGIWIITEGPEHVKDDSGLMVSTQKHYDMLQPHEMGTWAVFDDGSDDWVEDTLVGVSRDDEDGAAARVEEPKRHPRGLPPGGFNETPSAALKTPVDSHVQTPGPDTSVPQRAQWHPPEHQQWQPPTTENMRRMKGAPVVSERRLHTDSVVSMRSESTSSPLRAQRRLIAETDSGGLRRRCIAHCEAKHGPTIPNLSHKEVREMVMTVAEELGAADDDELLPDKVEDLIEEMPEDDTHRIRLDDAVAVCHRALLFSAVHRRKGRRDGSVVGSSVVSEHSRASSRRSRHSRPAR